ncbi:MAG: methionine adenosyltransferase domain-containing protein [Gammaproteobacteria bacterium]|nr:methionine adenosyltransferase domain-containing protein [Gammaproteobacteria bacterium]
MSHCNLPITYILCLLRSQTGRKLAVGFYGLRIPIGGGDLSGKHLDHIDRIGAYVAGMAAVNAVRAWGQECLVRLAYAPNTLEPLDISYDMLGLGVHFWDAGLPWNGA